VKLVIDDVDGVVCLPDWHKSRGARIEVFTAVTMGKPVFYFNPAEDVGLGAPFRFYQLQEYLKPADPGAGDQHSRSVGPPFDCGHAHGDSLPNAAKNAIEEACNRYDTPGRIDVSDDAPGIREITQLSGLPVQISESVEPGWLRVVVSNTEWVEMPWRSYEARREPGHIHEEARDLAATVAASAGGEERITDPETGGAKGRKDVRMDLIPWEPVWELARVYGKGDEKYPPDESGPNYLKGFDWSLSYGAALRHLTQWASGEDHDEEFGTHHLAHVAWHCFALMLFQWHKLGTDDRLTTLTGLTPVDPAQRTGRSEAARAGENATGGNV
jgi:hypothetical protein